MSTPLWPHQAHAIDEVWLALRGGERSLLLVSPTGMGKSRVVWELILLLAKEGWHAAVYTNRRMLIDQLSGVLDAAGVRHGVRAAGHPTDLGAPVQVCSIPTEAKRSFGEFPQWTLHGTGRDCLAVIDEAHLNKEEQARAVIEAHRALGHAVLGVTATPVDLGGLYGRVVAAGRLSDGRACGAVVPCRHYGPDEPDCRKRKGRASPDLLNEQLVNADPSGPDNRKAFAPSGALFGRVFDWFDRINPDRRPSILWAAGVRESLWFAEEFAARGVAAAHVDGEDVWLDGRFWKSDTAARDEVVERSKAGSLAVVCNRFVMREGIDMPWLAHGVMACVFSSVGSYVQAGGRLLRSAPGKAFATLQDHGGNWWRHGSLNADREWRPDETAAGHSAARAFSLRFRRCRYCRHQLSDGPACPDCGRANEREPSTCPVCRQVRFGRNCPGCGYEVPPAVKKSRPVVMTDGSIVELRGDIYRPQRTASGPDAVRDWVRCYYRARNGKAGLTFQQARYLYAQEHDWGWPSVDWPYMPKDPYDLSRRVRDVDPANLIGARPQGAAT